MSHSLLTTVHSGRLLRQVGDEASPGGSTVVTENSDADIVSTDIHDDTPLLHRSVGDILNTPIEWRVNKPKIPLSIKVALYFILPLFAGMSILAYVILNNQREFQQNQADTFGEVIAEQLAASAVEPLFADASMELRLLISNLPQSGNMIGVGLYDHKGEPLARSGKLPLTSYIDMAQRSISVPASLLTHISTGGDNKHTAGYVASAKVFISPIRFREVTGGYAIVAFDESEVVKNFDDLAKILLVSSLILFGSLSLIVFVISKSMTQPIVRLADAVSYMAQPDHQSEGSHLPERRDDELGQLIKAINGMSDGLARKSQIEQVLDRFISRDLANKVIDELDDVRFAGEHVDATVLFADIVGFTQISETLSPSEVSAFLNEYFEHFTACAKYYFGTVDKFIGDCVMVVFGARDKASNHELNAVQCALLMQKVTQRLNEERARQGKFTVQIRIGINSGPMLAGLLGARERFEYTVVGDSVNLASRLCNEANGGETIIQDALYQNVSENIELLVDSARTIKIRGKSKPVTIHNLRGIADSKSSGINAFINDLMQGRHAS
ncbi:HAMP domain-containing protein [bacterium]|nr:HAMP domain-containing protein [bacterium]